MTGTWAMKFFGFPLLLLLTLTIHAQTVPRVVERKALAVVVEQPVAIAVGPDRSLYILDLRSRIVRIPPGRGARNLVTERLSRPLDLKWTENGLWVADTGHHRLLRFDEAGKLLQTIDLKPSPCPEKTADCQFPAAEPVAVAEVDGILFWAGRRNHRICRLRLPEGKPLDCFGGRGEEPGKFQFPSQMVIDRDKFLHVTDVLNARLQIFDKDGRFFRQQGRFGFDPGELFRPNGLAIQRGLQRLFVSDGYFGTISLFQDGAPLGLLKDLRGQPIHFESPTGLAYHDGMLYVADTGGNRVWQLKLEETEPPNAGAEDRPRSGPDISRKNCLLCHLEWAQEGSTAIQEPDEQGIMPVASYRMCYSCHNGPVMDSRGIIDAGAQHPVVYQADKDEKRHAGLWPRKEKLPDDLFPLTHDHQLTCASCHTPHEDTESGTLYQGHRNAWLRVPNPDGRLCERCHESKAETARKRRPNPKGRNHPLGFHLATPPYRGAPDYSTDSHLHHGLPASLAEKGGSLDTEGRMICQSCHQIHGGVGDDLLLLANDRSQLCRQCHRRQYSRDKKQARRKGIHPVNIEPGEEMKRDGKKVRFVTCASCHPVHDGRPGTSMLLKPTPDLCHDCHRRQHASDKEDALKKGVHPVNFDLEEPITLQGKRIERVDCLTCHAVHRGEPDTPALVEDHHDGQLCRACHEDNQPVLGSDHDLRITARDSRNLLEETPGQSGLCGACHTLHRGKGKWPYLYAAAIVDDPSRPSQEGDRSSFKRDQLCLNCHQDHTRAVGKEKRIEFFSHPYKQIVLRSKQEQMPLLGRDESDPPIGAIGCATCHDPHVWQPDHRNKKQPSRSANHDNLEGDPHSSFLRVTQPEKTFCLDCHGGEARVKFLYFHDKDNARGKVDYLE